MKGEGACCFDRVGLWKRLLLAHARTIFEGPGGFGQEELSERSLTVFAPREGRGRLVFWPRRFWEALAASACARYFRRARRHRTGKTRQAVADSVRTPCPSVTASA